MKFIVVWRVVLLSISFQVALIPFVANHVLVPVFVLVLSRSSSIYLLMIYINHTNKYHLARPYSIGCLHNNQFLLYCLLKPIYKLGRIRNIHECHLVTTGQWLV